MVAGGGEGGVTEATVVVVSVVVVVVVPAGVVPPAGVVEPPVVSGAFASNFLGSVGVTAVTCLTISASVAFIGGVGVELVDVTKDMFPAVTGIILSGIWGLYVYPFPDIKRTPVSPFSWKTIMFVPLIPATALGV
ncbi:MAG: hypothetical protein BWX58_00115 [Deltaproteobacteria bacterium ADurb.Bin026]|nr:MAG: hypothetical protein BWX58_00115 [Deltaproteobacteria bacterium ADurb.Bin026]